MKSLSKLKKIALPKSVGKDKKDFQPTVKFDELALAAKDMQDMRDCYDSLLAAAAATQNSAYEFAQSLQEMGTCLLEKTALNDDEESGNVLGMLANVQLELQKLVDSYRSHIVLTITNPSESLLNELRTVEDMKRQCDEKREVYEYMIGQQKEKGKSKSGKGESITLQQLQAAHDEYEEEATLCAFRLKSLKQGQSRSLLTQAARHHAAQLNFFRKGLKSLEAVEPHVRMVAERQHIDYQFSDLEDDGGEDDNIDDGNDFEVIEGGELSFDYRLNKQGPYIVSTSPNSAEVEESGRSYVRASTTETAETNLDKNQGDFKVSNRVSSYSAPISAEKRFDPAEKVRQLLSSSAAKSNAYVLPTPVNSKETKTSSAPRTSASGSLHNLWHSSPLDEKKNEKDVDSRLSEPTIPRVHSVLTESNSDATSTQLPRPSAEGLSLPQVDLFNASDTKKIKRQAFSGPLTNKPLSVKPVSGGFPRLPVPQPSSPKASPSASPPLVSSPRISELHELPRPPGNQSSKTVKSSRVGHSAPLVLKNPEVSATNKFPSVVSSAASPLPTPPIIVSRSFSIPSSGQRAMTINVSNTKYLDTPQVSKVNKAASPPLTPLSQRASSISDLASHSSEIQVDAGGS
ncbi:binding of cytoplasm [Spatholobus suberectus]|nr:binding of cytoplasm [Spatholobus suberectus]